MPQGLPRKIRYAFVTQGLLSILAVVFGVSVVTLVTRDSLIRQRLDTESAAFWQREASEGARTALPATRTLQGYFQAGSASNGGIPPFVESLPDGISYMYRAQHAVLVDRRPAGSLYLVLQTHNVDRLMWSSAGAMIVLGLMAVLLITGLTYRKSRSIVLPVNRLAEEVAQWDPLLGDTAAPPAILHYAEDPGREVQALSTALRGLAGRVAEFVQRERDFTRDASHELRTPLTVIRVASDMMLADPAMPRHVQRSLERIQRAARDMEAVIDAFLILAREGGVAPVSEEFEVREVVLEQVEEARGLLAGKPVELVVDEQASPRLFAPPRVLGVVVGNVLQNACTFTEAGTVKVTIEADGVVVSDTGIGMSADTLQHAYEPFYRADAFRPLGKGFGLSIASRLVRRFGWQLAIESAQGEGTRVMIRFAPLPPG